MLQINAEASPGVPERSIKPWLSGLPAGARARRRLALFRAFKDAAKNGAFSEEPTRTFSKLPALFVRDDFACLSAAGAARVRPPLANLLSARAEETICPFSHLYRPASCPPLKPPHGTDE